MNKMPLKTGLFALGGVTLLMGILFSGVSHQGKELPDFVKFIIQLGKSINELNIWHSTGATIVAVQQGDQLLISPGPYTKLEAGNTIYFVGNELSVGLMHNLFFNEIETNK